MSMQIREAIGRTQEAFINGVWPQVAEAIGGGRIVPVEAVSNKEFLDQYSGIDHWHVMDNRSLIRGIASRCQWPRYKMFQTFTIRIGNKAVEQTELAKRLYAMHHANKGWLRPHLFIQAFFGLPQWSYDTFLYAGIAKMDDVLTIIESGKRGKKETSCDWWEDTTDAKWGQADHKRFAVVPFSTLQRKGLSFLRVGKLTT